MAACETELRRNSLDSDAVTSVVITQSNYVPWRGWYSMVRSADVLVYLDDVQYTRRDWRNRNLIGGFERPRWLTIPLRNSGNYHSRIHEMKVSEPAWWRSHLGILDETYKSQAHYQAMRIDIHHQFQALDAIDSLSEINRRLNDWVFSVLDISIKIHDSREFSSSESKTSRLVDICKTLGANEYVSGPAARVYLDESQFRRNNLDVRWVDYQELYPLRGSAMFHQELSILHTLAMGSRGDAIRLSTFRTHTDE